MKKLLAFAILAIGSITLTQASTSRDASPSPTRPESNTFTSRFIKANYDEVRKSGKSYPMYVDKDGSISKSAKSKPVTNIEDYIQLLASDLFARNMTNKQMLLGGFVLLSIIQGDVFPVDYSNLATGGNDKEKLLKNASKIAAYAMTYRAGLHTTKSDGGDGGIRASTKHGKSNVFFVSNNIKNDYAYKTTKSDEDKALNRQKALSTLRKNTSPQARALTEAYQILSTAQNAAPTDTIYKAMYNDKNVKRTDGGAPHGLPFATNDIDTPLIQMGIVEKSDQNWNTLSRAVSGASAFSGHGSRHSSPTNPQP